MVEASRRQRDWKEALAANLGWHLKTGVMGSDLGVDTW
jgi:hypothetical protein